MRKFKLTKIIFILGVILILAISCVLLIGKYVFNYSLVRKNSGVKGANRNVPSNKSNRFKAEIEENKKKQNGNADLWYESVEKKYLTINSNDGLLLYGTEFLQNEPGNNYAIIIHGYGKSQESVRDLAQNYYENGFTPITLDLKSHGKSEGKYIGMGWDDRKDIILWINKILEVNHDSQIILHGVSMGAATAIMVSGEKLPQNVKVVIEDCGYVSAWEVFKSELNVRFNLPSFPILNSTDLFTRMIAGYSLKEASPLLQINKSITPTLFIHGSDDNYIPVDMAYKLYDAANVKKELLVIDGAGHNECRYLNKSKYYAAVFGFINRAINKTS